jgi:hypothetical protein
MENEIKRDAPFPKSTEPQVPCRALLGAVGEALIPSVVLQEEMDTCSVCSAAWADLRKMEAQAGRTERMARLLAGLASGEFHEEHSRPTMMVLSNNVAVKGTLTGRFGPEVK